jgi:hypothetical protein
MPMLRRRLAIARTLPDAVKPQSDLELNGR